MRSTGFALLAARPARQLSIAAFAVKFVIIQLPYGKAFCSRKTAPTLKSCQKYETQTKKENTVLVFSFLVRVNLSEPLRFPTTDLNPAGNPWKPLF